MSISATTDKDMAATDLAAAHFRVDSSIEHIFRVVHSDPARERSNEEPIKLLEVNTETIASGIQPMYFGPDPSDGLLFPSIIIEIRPEEYELHRKGALPLPNDWRLGTEYLRPTGD